MIRDLELARVQGQRWRTEARTLLERPRRGHRDAVLALEPDRGRARGGAAPAEGARASRRSPPFAPSASARSGSRRDRSTRRRGSPGAPRCRRSSSRTCWLRSKAWSRPGGPRVVRSEVACRGVGAAASALRRCRGPGRRTTRPPPPSRAGAPTPAASGRGRGGRSGSASPSARTGAAPRGRGRRGRRTPPHPQRRVGRASWPALRRSSCGSARAARSIPPRAGARGRGVLQLGPALSFFAQVRLGMEEDLLPDTLDEVSDPS